MRRIDFSPFSAAASGTFVSPAALASSLLFQMIVRRACLYLRDSGQGDPLPPALRESWQDVSTEAEARRWWRSEVSALLFLMRSSHQSQPELLRAQLLVAILLAAPLDIKLEVAPATGLYLEGKWINRSLSSIECRDGVVSVRDHLGEVIASASATACSRAPVLVDDDWYRMCRPADNYYDAHEGDAVVVDDALSCLAGLAPNYHRWVSTMVGEISPLGVLDPELGGSRSDSDPLRFGGVGLTTTLGRLEAIDLLVHEASHQYFHLASWFGQVVEPNLGEFYSPLRKAPRPLDKILLAYHACGNIYLALSEIASHDHRPWLAASQLDGKLAGLETAIRQMERPLSTGQKLTQLGKELFEPLSAQLHEALDRGRRAVHG